MSKTYRQYTLRLPIEDGELVETIAARATEGNVHEMLVRLIHRAIQLYGVLNALKARHSGEAGLSDAELVDTRLANAISYTEATEAASKLNKPVGDVRSALNKFRHLLPSDADTEVGGLRP